MSCRVLVSSWLLASLAVAAPGCRPVPTPSPSVLDAFDIPPGTDFPSVHGARFGGLSGLASDAANGEILAISDDREGSRVFRLRIQESPLRVDPAGVIPLRGSPVKLDPEGIVLLPGGHLLVSSEGVQNEEPRQPPGIFEYSRDGAFIGALDLRTRYLPPERGPITHGVRANASFESLALTPDGSSLFTGTETALTQDGEAPDFEHGARARLLEYARQGDRFVPGREWLYELDPVAKPDFTANFFVTGLVELVALGDGNLLALERSYASEAGENGREMNRIRLYRVSLAGASDVSEFDSIAGRTDLRPASKRLLLDLGTTPGLPRALRALDNFEGLAFLPPRPDGRRLLLMVSDDNFSKKQRTWFVRVMIDSSW